MCATHSLAVGAARSLPVVNETELTELTTIIVASYVSRNAIAAADIPAFIATTHTALAAIAGECARSQNRTPAVPIKDSVMMEHLVCLEDGRKLRSLRRYLQRKYSMTPDQYRTRWNLPQDYPMTAPGYSALRSRIAKKNNPCG
jgi:predicted transcriptional regulator